MFLLVDTGAMFTCLPRPKLEALGLTSRWRVPVVLSGWPPGRAASDRDFHDDRRPDASHDVSLRAAGPPCPVGLSVAGAVHPGRGPTGQDFASHPYPLA